MREIEFRGKEKSIGEWVYGWLTWNRFDGLLNRIDTKELCYTVAPYTVGQYTGFKDKNGVKIFEGDIIFKAYTPSNEKLYQKKYLISFEKGAFRMHDLHCTNLLYKNRPHVLRYVNPQGILLYEDCFSMQQLKEKYPDYDGHYEVIGNIHDSPELLEEAVC